MPKPTTRRMFETEDLPIFSGTRQAVTGAPFKPTPAYRQARIATLPPMLDSRLSFANADSHDGQAAEYPPALDLDAERGQLIEPVGPQGGRIKPAYTRAQATRMYARLAAVQLAQGTRYQRTGQLVAEAIDAAFDEGYTDFEQLPRGTIKLHKPGTDETYVVYRKVEADYARVRLNIEPLARTY